MVATKSAMTERLMDLKNIFLINFAKKCSGVLSRMSPSHLAYFGYLRLSVLLPRLLFTLKTPCWQNNGLRKKNLRR